MRIGFVLDSGGIGGAEKQAVILAQELSRDGHKVLFFILNQNNELALANLLADQGISFFDLKFRFSSGHIGRAWQILKLMFNLKKFKIDVFMPYTIRPNVNINFLWQLTGAKGCIWNQRDEGRGFSGIKYKDKILWFALRNTSGFISNSIEGLDFLKSYISLKKPSTLIKNGTLIHPPKKERKSVLKELQIPPESFVAIMVANLTSYKDHVTLVKAWRLFSAQVSAELTPLLLLAGRQAETTDTVQSQISKLGIAESVKLVGMVEDINSLIHACDLCVFSSQYEGIPNGVLESMAAEKPVIASNILGIRQALGADYPYLFKVANSKNLANQLLELFTDAEKRAMLGRRNKKRIIDEFGVDSLKTQTIDFINKLLNEQD